MMASRELLPGTDRRVVLRRRSSLWIVGLSGLVAAALVLASVVAGLRLPGLAILSGLGDGSGFDYAGGPFGSFLPLEASFVDRALGRPPAPTEAGARFGGHGSGEGRTGAGAGAGGDTVVPHGLTNDESVH